MGAPCWPGRHRTPGSRASWLAAALFTFICAGCEVNAPPQTGPINPAVRSRPEIADADNPFTLAKANGQHRPAPPTPQLVYELAVLHVLVPCEEQAAMQKVWNFLREDALDADLRLRLRQNGMRVGVGHADWWEPIKAAMEAIDSHRVMFATPIRVPVGFPLSLELDSEPRDQTLFYIGADGILSGNTWPDSRNVLCVTYAPDPHDLDRIVLAAVPQVHQRRRGWEWVRTESGLWQVPRQAMQRFDASGFVLPLGPGEFVLLAPSENARTFGLLGGAFLTGESDGRRYDSYVFLRPQATHVGQHD